jgi:hypothetical protein
VSEDLTSTGLLIWTNPAAEKNQPTLVRLTPDDLTLAVVPAADLEPVIADLEDGGDVAGQVIPLDAVTGAEGDEDSASLKIRYRTGPSHQESKSVRFADKARRDEFTAALRAALGPGWHHRRKPVSRGLAAFWTLLPTALVALVTWGLHLEAARMARGNPPINWGPKGKLKLLALAAHWVEQQLGPTGVLIAGGVLVAAGLVLFAIVMSTPPMTVVIEPADPS